MSFRAFIKPIVSGFVAICVLIAFMVGYVQVSITNNNRNIVIAEQQAIERNNQLLCGVIILVNSSTTGASDVNHNKNSYSLRLQEDFKKLDKSYKCTS